MGAAMRQPKRSSTRIWECIVGCGVERESFSISPTFITLNLAIISLILGNPLQVQKMFGFRVRARIELHQQSHNRRLPQTPHAWPLLPFRENFPKEWNTPSISGDKR